jgi:uncharacterized protein YggU (UPF0235/DUF167 family)
MFISVKTIAKAKVNKIVRTSDRVFKIYVTEAPERGRANKKVIEILSEYFKVPRSRISIKRGVVSNKKVIEIQQV